MLEASIVAEPFGINAFHAGGVVGVGKPGIEKWGEGVAEPKPGTERAARAEQESALPKQRTPQNAPADPVALHVSEPRSALPDHRPHRRRHREDGGDQQECSDLRQTRKTLRGLGIVKPLALRPG